MTNAQFVFKGHDYNIEKGKVVFHFTLNVANRNIDFTEKIYFPPVASSIPPILLKSILNNLMLILGISYWKTYCPKEIVIENNFLTEEMANFWNIVYAKGLGELFYKNKIDFRGLVNFPSTGNLKAKSSSFPRKDRYLLGLGGGKDSIVVAEMLKRERKEFDLLFDDTKIHKDVANVIGKKPIPVKRELDSKLFELNKEKRTYNGHIPVSVIYAMLGIMTCALYDYKSFVVGNEKSANYGNVEYLGEVINHQWSKSEEFENLFNDYVREFITPDITYYSPLRQMSELEVVEEFVKYPKYFKVFSSCNRNFKILRSAHDDNRGKWCGKCAKCLFVFICLSAFLSKEKVLNIFGKNLLDDKNLILLFEELAGVRNFKPFECVGTPQETREAIDRIIERGEFNGTSLIKHFKKL